MDEGLAAIIGAVVGLGVAVVLYGITQHPVVGLAGLIAGYGTYQSLKKDE